MSNVIATTKEKPLVIQSRVNESGVPKILTFVNPDGTPHAITSYDFEYLLKAKPGTEANIFRLSIGDGLTIQGDDDNQLIFEIDEERATIRPLLYFGLFRSVSENKTWFNNKHIFFDGYFDGIEEETDTITIAQDGGSVLITITGGDTQIGGIQSIVPGTNITVDDTDPLNPIISSTGGSPSQEEFDFNDQANDYTLVLVDATDIIVRMTKATSKSLTVPTNASVAFPIGSVIPIQRTGDGALAFVAAGGVTITPTSGVLTDAGENVVMTLIKSGTNTWGLQNGVPSSSVTAGTGIDVTGSVVSIDEQYLQNQIIIFATALG